MVICLVSYFLCLCMFMLAYIESDNIKEKAMKGLLARKVKYDIYTKLINMFIPYINSHIS